MVNLFKKLSGDNGATASPAPADMVAADERQIAEPIHVTDADFASVILQAEAPAVVDLWAEWCGPCHMIAPSVEKMAQVYEGRAVIAKLNVDDNPMVPGQYGIMGIPTLLFFKDGKEVDRQVGVTNYTNLANKLERLLD
jgi:thioredoxin 1